MSGPSQSDRPADQRSTEAGGLTVDYLPNLDNEFPTQVMPPVASKAVGQPGMEITPRLEPQTNHADLRRTRLIAAVGFFLFVVVPLRFLVELFVLEGFSYRLLLMSIVLGDVLVFLLWKKETSERTILWLESGVFCVLALGFAWRQYEAMKTCAELNDAIALATTIRMTLVASVVLTFSYVIFIPNRWQRAARMILLLMAFPIVTQVLFIMMHPEINQLIKTVLDSDKLIESCVQAFVVTALAIYGAYVINNLRMDVEHARSLNQYRLGRRLGAGGMGEVYLAEHRLLKRPCAIKVIAPSRLADERAIRRFEREVQATAMLSHPNTIEIYDYGQTTNGTFYYVMEYLAGLSLAGILERFGRLPPGRLVYLLRQAAEALVEAHAHGLIHRDIKPGNIFASRRGGRYDVAKLLDFGLVKEVTQSELGPALSVDQAIRGTPLYMAPEQAVGSSEIDHRVDIYSMGATAYELLTGSPPFDAPSRVQLFAALTRDDPTAPSLVNPDVPRDLDEIVLKCLSKDPNQRYKTADALARAFRECSAYPEWSEARAEAWWNETGLMTEHPKTQ